MLQRKALPLPVVDRVLVIEVSRPGLIPHAPCNEVLNQAVHCHLRSSVLPPLTLHNPPSITHPFRYPLAGCAQLSIEPCTSMSLALVEKRNIENKKQNQQLRGLD